MNRTYAGVDYSMTCPSICLYQGTKDDFSFEGCEVHFLAQHVKNIGSFHDNIVGHEYPEWDVDEERYHKISKWAIEFLTDIFHPDIVLIEGYSFGSKGRVFNLAENTGLLKHKLWSRDYIYVTATPGEIKKFATGKGNAKKEDMELAFVQDTGINLRTYFKQTDNQWSPSGDVIDSYYLCKYALYNYEQN